MAVRQAQINQNITRLINDGHLWSDQRSSFGHFNPSNTTLLLLCSFFLFDASVGPDFVVFFVDFLQQFSVSER